MATFLLELKISAGERVWHVMCTTSAMNLRTSLTLHVFLPVSRVAKRRVVARVVSPGENCVIHAAG